MRGSFSLLVCFSLQEKREEIWKYHSIIEGLFHGCWNSATWTLLFVEKKKHVSLNMPHILLPCPPLNPTTTFLLFALDMEAPSSQMTAWFHLHISLSERERSWERIKKTHMLLLRPLGQPWAYNKHLNVTPLKLTLAMIRKEGKRRKSLSGAVKSRTTLTSTPETVWTSLWDQQ